MATDEYNRQVSRAQILESIGCTTLSKSEADELFKKASERVIEFSKQWKLHRAFVIGPYARGEGLVHDLVVCLEAEIEPKEKSTDIVVRFFDGLPRVVAVSLTHPPVVPTPKGLMRLTDVEGFYEEPHIVIWERRKPTKRKSRT